VQPEDTVVPIMSVGALNPNGTDALFSNAGPWVRAYAAGAAVMSTMPEFQGGLEPTARTEAYARRRESLDPDDYTSGFALWSGTSFAAPLFAGQVAAQLVGGIDPDEDGRKAAVVRSWNALSALTDLGP
jgi:serine protease